MATAALALAVQRFRFSERRRARRAPAPEAPAAASLPPTAPVAPPALRSAPLAKFLASTRLHFLGVFKSTGFLVVLGATLVNALGSLSSASDLFGVNTFPVTYWVLQILDGTFFAFILILIAFYGGVVVWGATALTLGMLAHALDG